MNYRWRVARTKSKKRWVAWRVRSKRKTGKVFDSWYVAFQYALMMATFEGKHFYGRV